MSERSYFVWVVSCTEVLEDQVIDKRHFLWGTLASSSSPSCRRLGGFDGFEAGNAQALLEFLLDEISPVTAMTRRQALLPSTYIYA